MFGSRTYITILIKRRKKKRSKYFFTFTFNHTKIKGKIMAITMRDTQQGTGTLHLVDGKGKSAKAKKGSVKFTSTDETIFTIEQDATDENTATVKAQAPGVAALQVAFQDEDGNDHKLDDMAVEVLPGDASAGGFAMGPLSEQTPAAAAVTSPAAASSPAAGTELPTT